MIMRHLNKCLKKHALFLLLLLFSVVNLLFMHYQFLVTIGIDFYFSKTSVLDNFMAVFLDVTILFLFFLLLCWGRVKISLLLTFITTLLLSFCNIVYSRFFGQYITFSAFGQANNLVDDVVVKSILSEIRGYDIIFLIFLLLFICVFVKSNNKLIEKGYLRVLGGIWVALLILVALSHSIYLVGGSVERAIQTLYPSYSQDPERPNWENVYPNWATFHKGLFRSDVVDYFLKSGNSIELTSSQIQTIEKEFRNHELRSTKKTIDNSIENVIFIIVESYLSASSDLKIDGKEITPYLNALKRDSNVYYNGHVIPNAKIGRSSDGQLIYMTGVLPLRSEVTVDCAKNDSLVGLPSLLLKHGQVKHSQILIPTSPSLWEQNPMNKIYGIETMYSKNDYKKNQTGDDLSDKDMFEFANQLDNELPPYSFSLMLTLSMHEPYDECVEHGFQLENKNLTNRYRNYLITCHYFDQQIGKYIDHLKKCGLYEKSLIVIAADHEPHLKNMDVDGVISDELPLFIINGGIDKNQVWNGPCNQLDVYTTLLDIMGVESEWRGLGHTLLNPNYSNSVSENTWQISEWIIKGDYFRREKNK